MGTCGAARSLPRLLPERLDTTRPLSALQHACGLLIVRSLHRRSVGLATRCANRTLDGFFLVARHGTSPPQRSCRNERRMGSAGGAHGGSDLPPCRVLLLAVKHHHQEVLLGRSVNSGLSPTSQRPSDLTEDAGEQSSGRSRNRECIHARGAFLA